MIQRRVYCGSVVSSWLKKDEKDPTKFTEGKEEKGTIYISDPELFKYNGHEVLLNIEVVEVYKKDNVVEGGANVKKRTNTKIERNTGNNEFRNIKE